MSSYNRLNGTFTSENEWLLTQVLRDEWHYDGVVMSDWFGSHSTAPTVNAGLDLEMPGPPRDRGAKLVAAVEAGEVTPATVRERTVNVLRLMERTGACAPARGRAEDRAEHRTLIRRAGAEGMVLLKNDGALPLVRQRQGCGHRPEREGGADHGRRQRAAQPALPRLALRGLGRRARRRPAGSMPRAPPTTASNRCSRGASRSTISPVPTYLAHRFIARRSRMPKPSGSAASPKARSIRYAFPLAFRALRG